MPRAGQKLPWIPSEQQWLDILAVFSREPARNRLMLALAYDAALRREELCSLRTDDLDPAHRMVRVRPRLRRPGAERAIPYSATTGVSRSLRHLEHRAKHQQEPRPVVLVGVARRNRAEPLKPVDLVEGRAPGWRLAAGVPGFSTHTTWHLCLTDLARMGWELHAIATFAGHASTDTTLRYIHLSGRSSRSQPEHDRDPCLADQPAHRRGRRRRWAVNPSAVPAVVSEEPRRVRWTGVDLGGFDRSGTFTADERAAVETLGPMGLRRNRAQGIPRRTATSWKALTRLVEPLDAARVALRHRDDVRHRRAGLHVVGLVIEHCMALDRCWWAWSTDEWAGLLA